jgi:phage terminase large subunit
MVTETKVDIALNKGAQSDFVHSEAEFPAFMGGQGSGKTAAGVIKAWMFTVQHPGSRGVWTEPVAAMFAESLLPTLRELADEDGNKYFGDYEGAFWQEQGKGGPNHRIEFANGCLWMLKAAETPERLVGFEVAWVLMNEAGSTEHGSQEQAYLNLIGRLRQKNYPHWLGVATTPAGYNWLYREWVDQPKPGHVLFTGSTFENKKNLPDDYIERMAQEYVEGTPMYDERVLGKFVQMSGLVLPGFDAAKMTSPWPDELFTHKLAGVDFGSQSPTTVIETAMNSGRHIWVREWLYKRECDDETFVKACGDAMKDGVTQFICDPSGKDRIDWMCRQGIPAVKAESNKIERRVKAWTTPISEGRLTVDINSGFLIRELTGLVWAERRGRDMETDRFSQSSPDHAFDGGASALMRIDRGYFDLEKTTVRYLLS